MKRRIILIVLMCIMAVALIVRMIGLTDRDFTGDEALNAARAVEWFDFVQSSGQTTPVQWFAEKQWWQPLSFHDHPPLVFAYQFFSSFIFGDSVFGLRLPFVLIGLVSVLMAFLLARELFHRDDVALLAALVMALFPSAIWISRLALLDGFIVLWTLVAWYFFVKAKDNPRAYIWWGVACAAGLLSKYTFLYMLPAFVVVLIMRRAYRERYVWFACIVGLLLMSPVIVYNSMLFATRGHFDAALSSMLGMRPQDFALIANRVSSVGGTRNLYFLVERLIGIGGLPAFIIGCIASLFIVVHRVLKRKEGFPERDAFMILLGVSIVAFFYFLQAEPHFVTLAVPFIVMAIAYLYDAASGYHKWMGVFIAVISVVILVPGAVRLERGEGGRVSFFYESPLASHGYNDLYTWTERLFTGAIPHAVIDAWGLPQVRALQEQNRTTPVGSGWKTPRVNRAFVILDDRVDWVPKFWLSNRYFTVHSLPVMGVSDFAGVLLAQKLPVNFFLHQGFTSFYLVTPVVEPQTEEDKKNRDNFETIRRALQEVTEYTETEEFIFDARGTPALVIYGITFKTAE